MRADVQPVPLRKDAWTSQSPSYPPDHPMRSDQQNCEHSNPRSPRSPKLFLPARPSHPCREQHCDSHAGWPRPAFHTVAPQQICRRGVPHCSRNAARCEPFRPLVLASNQTSILSCEHRLCSMSRASYNQVQHHTILNTRHPLISSPSSDKPSTNHNPVRPNSAFPVPPKQIVDFVSGKCGNGLKDILERLPTQPVSRTEELLPNRCIPPSVDA